MRVEINEIRLRKAIHERLNEVAGEQLDQEYLAAVESGDLKTASRLVARAAHRAGYWFHGYHNTANGDIKRFEDGHRGPRPEHSMDELAKGGWFSDSKNSLYGPYTYSVYIKLDNPYVIDGDAVAVRCAKNAAFGAIGSDDREAVKNARRNLETTLGEKEPYYIAMRLAQQAFTDKPGAKTYGEALRQKLQSEGYDSVYFRSTDADMCGGADWCLPFMPEVQVKSAEPVVYDDQGNIIPLSKRFTNSDDIRYEEE